MIKLSSVSKVYGNGTKALNNINLEIKDGEFAFIVGRSGAGKSSLLKMLLMEEEATSGEIYILGKKLSELKRREVPELRRKIGVVFQDFRLIDNMTVYQNVEFAMRVTNATSKQIRRRVPYILGLVELTAKAKCRPFELSGGQQQRVALARALANNPELIIADEPTGNVDPEMSLEIVELLNEINKCGTTVLMVTHEHELVRRFGHRVIKIENGDICADTAAGGDMK